MEPDYPAIREAAYAAAAAHAFASDPPIRVRVTGIDDAALRVFQTDWRGHHPSGYGGFNWEQLWYRYCHHERRTFHCALWYGEVLCGMAVGTVPRTLAFLKMRYLEGRPGGHPLRGKVAEIALLGANRYATALGVPEIRLEDPAPGLVPMYQSLGFGSVLRERGVRYLLMQIRPAARREL